MPQESLFQYVFDSSSLIDIERNKKVNSLRKRHGDVILPQKVAEEINQPRSPLQNFINRYPDVVTPFSPTEEDSYLEIRAQDGIDDGEAAALALALSRKTILVIQDKKGRSKAQNHGIQCLDWRDFTQGA